MRNLWALSLTLSATLIGATSCKSVDCGEGTTERDGACVAATANVDKGICGKFTKLEGTVCVPEFPPTVCDDATATGDFDATTGVTTCIGTGAATGCAARLPCPTPTDNTQAVCGQIYDFESNTPFAAAGATGTKCTTTTTSGPCALAIHAFDAAVFASAPTTTAPIAAQVAIDDCGRYQVTGIAQPTGPAILLALDDAAGGAAAGPGGVTNAVGVALLKSPNSATRDFAHFVVPATVSSKWDGGTDGPSLAKGLFAAVYRAHATGTDTASGVTVTFAPATNPTAQGASTARDFYFAGATRSALDAGLSATAANGSALFTDAAFSEAYSGAGSLPAGCTFDIHGGAAVPGSVFVQVFRPTALPSQTCSL